MMNQFVLHDIWIKSLHINDFTHQNQITVADSNIFYLYKSENRKKKKIGFDKQWN